MRLAAALATGLALATGFGLASALLLPGLAQRAQAAAAYNQPVQHVPGVGLLLLVPADRQDEETAVLDKISRGESIEHYETWRRRKDGTLFPISLMV